MIVTMYRDPAPAPGSQTHVFITPGMAIDLKPLGSAAMDFETYFDHLLTPQRVWESEWLKMGGMGNGQERAEVVEVDPVHTHREWQEGLVRHDETGLEELFVNGQSGKHRCCVPSSD